MFGQGFRDSVFEERKENIFYSKYNWAETREYDYIYILFAGTALDIEYQSYQIEIILL